MACDCDMMHRQWNLATKRCDTCGGTIPRKTGDARPMTNPPSPLVERLNTLADVLGSKYAEITPPRGHTAKGWVQQTLRDAAAAIERMDTKLQAITKQCADSKVADENEGDYGERIEAIAALARKEAE